MIANTRDLRKAIDEVLKTHGFALRRSTWYRHTPETILVFDLQKDDFGGQYYINLAIALLALNCVAYPREEHCHVRVRLESVIDDNSHIEQVKRVLNLEDQSLNTKERLQLLQGLVQLGVEFLERFTTLDLVARELQTNLRIRNRSTVQLRRYFDCEQAP